MKVIVTGVRGQLGHDCLVILQKNKNFDVVGIDIDDLDLTDEKSVRKFVLSNKPDVVIHCAAWTNVDGAEKEKDKCFAVNSLATKYLVDAVKLVGSKILYISTDYVFDGSGDTPFSVDSQTNPLNYYGFSKLCGEKHISSYDKFFIIRTSWVFGKNGNNFVKTMIKLSEKLDEISVVCDQVGSPTYSKDLALLIVEMIQTEKYGIYHATNEGFCSWADFAKEIFHIIGKNVNVIEVLTSSFHLLRPEQAIRPLNSRLSKESLNKACFSRLPHWKDALARYLKELNE